MLISLLISIIVVCLIVGVIFWLLTMLPIPQPFQNVIKVCIVLLCLIYVLSILGGFVHPMYLYR